MDAVWRQEARMKWLEDLLLQQASAKESETYKWWADIRDDPDPDVATISWMKFKELLSLKNFSQCQMTNGTLASPCAHLHILVRVALYKPAQNGLRATRGQHSASESAKQQDFLLAVPVQGQAVPVQPSQDCLLYRYKGLLYRYRMRAPNLAALGLALVPVQEPVYRYKRVGGRVISLVRPWRSPVGDFVADVAPRAVRAHLLPELCEEAGRGSVFTVLDVAPRFDVVEVARSPRRNVGSRRGLVRWIRDFERNPRSPHLPDLVKLVHRTWRSLVDPAEGVLVRGFVRCQGIAFEVGYIGFTPNLIELDRDTLHTRLGSAHECHSGVRLVLLRWCRSCQLDLLSTDQLVWIELDSRNGARTGVFTVLGTGMLTVPIWIGSDLTFPTVEPQVPAAAPSVNQDRGKGVAS
uniref:Uncharacterized protein n=1 Tax=Ananas comosus var. bracteatus TaxID=296719 RepID=A0A6V7NSU1_ANACO|nr:unnamed protein product [Ananas comosus var. bracteatus]